MNEFLTMMAMVVVGTVILMVGIRLNRNEARSLDGSRTEIVSWGTGFFVTFTGHAALISYF
ncbi:MAG: hypothetical protein KJ850_04175 [Gammaproteobacteria bacterium]|nr:hypothetical protein [Gammaproteobacteria bacterium]MBU1624226.1 hypothetical protein [Gammaproteobacteria bacterium]MBU1981954.1 hypothetical protein [Gammaproteobacteria bacterium]